jgi:hypothetical protein
MWCSKTSFTIFTEPHARYQLVSTPSVLPVTSSLPTRYLTAWGFHYRFIFKMATAVFTKILENSQDLTQLIPESL